MRSKHECHGNAAGKYTTYNYFFILLDDIQLYFSLMCLKEKGFVFYTTVCLVFHNEYHFLAFHSFINERITYD